MLFDQAAARFPERPAVEEASGRSVSYRELQALSGRFRDALRDLGVRPGDRVGICVRKSIDAVAAILGVMKAGAAYVPIDPHAPAWRGAFVLADCAVSCLVVEREYQPGLERELGKLGHRPPVIELGPAGSEGLGAASRATHSIDPGPDDLAYILYTSGSTGMPKGVMLTHRSAVSFVDWCSEVFRPTEADRFSSHAPLHFDLSILDLYVPLKHGASVTLIGAEEGREPVGLAALIAERRITVWYSAPSILSLLAQYGKMARHDYSALRLVLFAGEIFPVKHLRNLKALVRAPRYFNLYGPTETNVCTFYEIPDTIPAERSDPYPIGRVCSHFQARIVDERGHQVADGTEGELCIAGPGVMRGYWNRPDQTAGVFLAGPDGLRWYRTGDMVMRDAGGELVFLGRRDRMVKRRGHRVELGEIESGLYRHPTIREAAVLATTDEERGLVITAFFSAHGTEPLSIVELKRFCAENLPAAMIPDRFVQRDSLPKTSTDKIDYQGLAGLS